MSDSVKSTPDAPKSETPKSETPKSETPKSATETPSGDGGKSSRESVGGAATGHYGFFSNVRTPEYKSGWDEIWGKKKKTRSRKPAGPVTVEVAFDELPDELREALAAAAKAKLGRVRGAYDRSARAGTAVWRIECTVRR